MIGGDPRIKKFAEVWSKEKEEAMKPSKKESSKGNLWGKKEELSRPPFGPHIG